MKMLISVTPAGLEKMFVEVGRTLGDGEVEVDAGPPTKEEIEGLLAAAPRYGIDIQLPKDA